jgi:hypothetical protein
MSIKGSAKAKREAIAETFGEVPNLDPEHLKFLHTRPHLPMVRKGESVDVGLIEPIQRASGT